MFEYPVSDSQRELIETLRIKQNISNDVMDQLCQRMFETPLDRISRRQATALITSMMEERDSIHREIQKIAGQRSLF